MKRSFSIILCFIILLSCIIPAYAAASVPKRVVEATKSVVRIEAEYKRQYSLGSGFVIKNDGEEVLFATNDHVVENNPLAIRIWVSENRQVDAEIVFTIPAKDLCVLRVKESLNLVPLTLAEEPAQLGSAIYAVGYPGATDVLSDTEAHSSESVTITDGIISSIRTYTIVKEAEPVKLLLINAAINHGNSGGPLFNTRGEVIGVNTYGVSGEDVQGVFGSVDISELWKLLDEYDITLVEEVPETEPAPTETTVPVTEPVVVEEPEPEKSSGGLIVGVIAAIILIGGMAAVVVILARKGKTGKGITLRSYMQQFPQGMSVGEAVAMLLPAALQLRDMHMVGKLHLQINPDTIVISSKGASLKQPSKNEMDRHSSGFAAQEVYRGAGYGVASDVYSLAAVLLFAVTGRMPVNALQQETLEADISTLAQKEPAFAQILRSAMAFLPQDRIQSVQELIYGISAFHNQQFQAVQPVKAGPSEAELAAKREAREAAAIAAKEKMEAAAAAAQQRRDVAAAIAQQKIEAAAAAKREKEAAAAAARQEREAAEAAARQEREAAAAAEKRRKEAEAAEKLRQKEAELAAKQQAKEAAAAERQRQKEAAAAEKQRQKEAKAAAKQQAREAKAAVSGKKSPKIAVICVIAVVAVAAPMAFIAAKPAISYNKAISLKEAGQYEQAVAAFGAISDYKDSAQQMEACREYIRENTYQEAIALMDAGQYEQAIAAFEAMDGYQDSEDRIESCRIAAENLRIAEEKEAQYREAEALAAEGKHAQAGIAFAKLEGYKDARDRSFEQWGFARKRTTIDAYDLYGGYSYIGLKEDGTVVASCSNTSVQRAVESWQDIVEVCAIGNILVGLKSDGTVVATGPDINSEKVAEIQQWTDITALLKIGGNLVGIKKDGTVVVPDTGYAYWDSFFAEIESRSGIVELYNDVQFGHAITIGLHHDGTLLVAPVGFDAFADWENVISCSYYTESNWNRPTDMFVLGLCADGTLYVMCDEQCSSKNPNAYEYSGKIEGWTDIVDICGPVALHADGTVSVYPEDVTYKDSWKEVTDKPWKDAVKDWEDIVALFGSSYCVYGLKSDGTVVAAGSEDNGSLNVSNWTDIAYITLLDDMTFGIQKDGTVLVANHVTIEPENWTNIQIP